MIFRRIMGWVPVWVALGCLPCDSAGQFVVSFSQKAEDVRFLDGLCLLELEAMGMNLERLTARDRLINLLHDQADTDYLTWGLAVHDWLRSANDAHLRVDFAHASSYRRDDAPPSREELLDIEGPWAAFGPGGGVSASARAAWLERTWAWVGTLPNHKLARVQSNWTDSIPISSQTSLVPDDHTLESEGKWNAGMALEHRGDYMLWSIRSFGEGSNREFSRSFRKCLRSLRKANLPVLLDLAGNLGGYRTRRHAVLSVFSDVEDWPEEQERSYGLPESPFQPVPCMPLVRVRKPLEVRLALFIDGLTFSASLLLVDALLEMDRARAFGSAPLGFPGGCSGSPKPHVLPGSGWILHVPTGVTRLTLSDWAMANPHYGMVPNARGVSLSAARAEAVRWLVDVDLNP